MILTYVILSYLLAPILAGLLDRKFDTGYPIDTIFTVVFSPFMVPIIVLVYIYKLIGSIELPDITKPFVKIYEFCKGKNNDV